MFNQRERGILACNDHEIRALKVALLFQDLLGHAAHEMRRIRINLSEREFHESLARFAQALELKVNGAERGLYELEDGCCEAASLCLNIWGGERGELSFETRRLCDPDELIARAAASRVDITRLSYPSLLDAAIQALPVSA